MSGRTTERDHCLNVEACAAKKPGKHCPRCNIIFANSDPEFKQRRLDALRARMAQPGEREKMAERMRAVSAEARKDPSYIEKLRSTGRRAVKEWLRTPEARAAWQESRKSAGKKRTEMLLGWCPPKYRPLYRDLTRRKGVATADARRIVEEQIRWEAEKERREGRAEVARRAAAMEAKHRRDLEQRY